MRSRTLTTRGASALLVLLLIAACASTPPDRVALDALKISKVTADAAMRVCASLYAQGRHYDPASQTWSVVEPAALRFTEDQKAKAIVAYDKYQAAATTAAFALKAATTQGDVDAIMVNVSAALASLLEMLRAFGVKV